MPAFARRAMGVLGVLSLLLAPLALASSPAATTTTTPLIIASTDAASVRAGTAMEVRESGREERVGSFDPGKREPLFNPRPPSPQTLPQNEHTQQYATHDFDHLVHGLVTRALGRDEQQPHAVADAVLASPAADAVVVVLGTAPRWSDLQDTKTAASLTAIVRDAGSAAVLPHVRHGQIGGGCRAKAAARLRDAASAAKALVFGCGPEDASVSEAAAALSAAGWAPGAGNEPLLLIACTPGEATDAQADAEAMARAHTELVAAARGGGEAATRVVSLLAVRPPAPEQQQQEQQQGRRRLQQQEEGGAGGGLARGGGGGGSSGDDSGGGGGGGAAPGTCDERCQSQVKWLQGILAVAVMLIATAGGLTSLGALQGPSVFEKPREQ